MEMKGDLAEFPKLDFHAAKMRPLSDRRTQQIYAGAHHMKYSEGSKINWFFFS